MIAHLDLDQPHFKCSHVPSSYYIEQHSFEVCQIHLEDLLKYRLLVPICRIDDLVDLESSSIISISDKFPGDSDHTGLAPHFENH